VSEKQHLFLQGRPQSIDFLKGKWERELVYRLVKELWAFSGNHISVRFQYEYHLSCGTWFRAYGNENWEFLKDGLMSRRAASINDVEINSNERLFLWTQGPRLKIIQFGQSSLARIRQHMIIFDGNI